VVHRDGRILVTGYNGAPAGLPHCDHVCDCYDPTKLFDPDHVHVPSCNWLKPCTKSQHAERNCIDWAARHGIRLEGAELVTTNTPCSQCAGSIINSGIKSVVSLYEYRLRDGMDMMKAAGVVCSLYEDVR
jgi:dCMP deaminase